MYQNNTDSFPRKKLYLLIFTLICIVKLPIFMMFLISNYIPKFDDAAYLYYAHLPINKDFMYMAYAWGYPLLLKILNYNKSYMFVLQFIISALAWSYIILHMVLSELNNKKLIIGLFILYISSIGISVMDNKIMTESLTCSCLCILLSISYLYKQGYVNWIKIILFALTSIWFIIIRDSNAYFALLITLYILLNKHVTILQKIFLVLIVTATTSIVIITAKPIRSPIHQHNVLSNRIYPNPEYKQWYAENLHLDLNNFVNENMQNCITGILAPNREFTPHFLNELNKIGSFVCYSSYANQYYYHSDRANKDYLKFLEAHPGFIFFNYGKELSDTNYLLLTPRWADYGGKGFIGGQTKLPLAKKIIRTYLTYIYDFCSVLLFIITITYMINNKMFIRYLLTIFIPAWVFALICFVVEPFDLIRHVLCASWFMLVGGIFLMLKNNATKSRGIQFSKRL